MIFAAELTLRAGDWLIQGHKISLNELGIVLGWHTNHEIANTLQREVYLLLRVLCVVTVRCFVAQIKPSCN